MGVAVDDGPSGGTAHRSAGAGYGTANGAGLRSRTVPSLGRWTTGRMTDSGTSLIFRLASV
jgi:hypothetical protein